MARKAKQEDIDDLPLLEEPFPSDLKPAARLSPNANVIAAMGHQDDQLDRMDIIEEEQE